MQISCGTIYDVDHKPYLEIDQVGNVYTTFRYYITVAAAHSSGVLFHQILHVGNAGKVSVGPLDSYAGRSWQWLP